MQYEAIAADTAGRNITILRIYTEDSVSSLFIE